MTLGPDEIKAIMAGGGSPIPGAFPGQPQTGMADIMAMMMKTDLPKQIMAPPAQQPAGIINYGLKA